MAKIEITVRYERTTVDSSNKQIRNNPIFELSSFTTGSGTLCYLLLCITIKTKILRTLYKIECNMLIE